MTRFYLVLCLYLVSSCSSSNQTDIGADLDLNALPEPTHRATELHTTEDLDYVVLAHATVNTITNDGILLVADTHKNRIIAFNRDLDTLSIVGGSGVGPGEFVVITSISLDSNDSLIVFDHKLNRISVHARDRDRWKYFRSEAFNTRTEDLYDVGTVFRNESGSFITVETQSMWSIEETGKVTALRRFVRTDIGSVETIRQTRALELYKIPASRGFNYNTPPFARQMLWVYDSQGYIHVLHWTDRIEITKYSHRGDSISTVRIEAVPVPVTDENLAAVEGSLSASQLSQVYATHPTVRMFILSNRGTYWLELETTDTEHRAWIELDESGVIQKHVLIDFDTRLQKVHDDLIFAQSMNSSDEPMLSVLKIEPLN
jgi:hypothetical protein